MLNPADFTPDQVDISAGWKALTGESVIAATAHLRAGAVSAVRVERQGGAPQAMCRNGAAAVLSDDFMQWIEATARGRVQ